ncbi:hypothetical protein ABZ487_32150, partial [Micromonospora aurantiaca]
GPGHPTTIRALGVAAAALLADHRPRQSAARYRNLVAALTTTSGPASGHTLAARADLARALHHAGSCATAHHELANTWHTRRLHAGDTDVLALRMLTRLAGMYRDCADPGLADHHFWQSLHLARVHPEPLRRQVQHAAARPPRPEHRTVCTYPPPAHAPRSRHRQAQP